MLGTGLGLWSTCIYDIVYVVKVFWLEILVLMQI